MLNNKIEYLLKNAKVQEEKYNWIEAADIYKQACFLISKDLEKTAELEESIGLCLFRAAYQTKTICQYKKILKQAAEAYEKVSEIYQKTSTNDRIPKINHTQALIAFINARIETNIPKKRKLLAEWFRLENEALNYYEKIGNQIEIGKTCNELAEKHMDKRILESNWNAIQEGILKEVEYSDRSIRALAKANNEYEIARAYMLAHQSYNNIIWFRVVNKTEDLLQKIEDYGKKALEFSKKTGDAYLIGLTFITLAMPLAQRSNPDSAIQAYNKAIKYGKIARDNYIVGRSSLWKGTAIYWYKIVEEDPDKRRKEINNALNFVQDGITRLSIINSYGQRFSAYFSYVDIVKFLASSETKLENKFNLLEKAVEIGRDYIEEVKGETIHFSTILLHGFSNALHGLAEIQINQLKKRKLLEEALFYRKKQLKAMQQISPFDYVIFGLSYNYQAIILTELARMETGQEKIKLLEKAAKSMKNCEKLIEKDLRDSPGGMKNGRYGLQYYMYGQILEQLYALTKNKELIAEAIKAYKGAIKRFSELALNSRIAESYWQIARLNNHLGDNLESSNNYLYAAENYKLTLEKNIKIKEFYGQHVQYMQAWSEIEQAKYNHKNEEYEQSSSHYKNAAKLHESSEIWNYLTPNYLAWAKMEQAEDNSRKDEPLQASDAFKKAQKQFIRAKESIQLKIKELQASDEKKMATNLIKASDLRQRYCQARISIEQAKLFDRNGKHNQSAKSYGKATKILSQLLEEAENKQTIKELQQVLVISKAWQKMAQAEEKNSSDLYLEASQLFEQANEFSLSKKTSLIILGNSSFCKGLAAGYRFQTTLDRSIHTIANKHMKTAATYYLRAGFEAASEYSKATQRLFDAYLYMNNAEDESDPEKSAKYYHMAEQVLKISAELFGEAKHPEKKSEVQRILETVKEEKELAISLSAVLTAPKIASTTTFFTTPTLTSEESVGLERFNHADVQVNIFTDVSEVKVGESFCLLLDFMNVGKESGLLMKVENFIPPDFVVVKKPEIYRLEDSTLNMKGKQLEPLKLVEVKLILQASKKGLYHLNPQAYYLDEVGQNKILQLKTLEINVNEVVLSDRIPTGTSELDSLLLGGIPNEYAIILTGSPSDERNYLIKNFLNVGIKENEIVFYVSTEFEGLESLLESPNFFLFLCNSKPKTKVPDLSNVFKLRSKTDLTNLSISLSKAYRNLDQSKKKRICIETVSDILLDYGAKATRKWISELITDFSSKEFTMLAVIDSSMHMDQEANAVINLFDGEITITQSSDPLDCKKSILVKKLRNQDYIKNPICLFNF